MEPKSRIVFDGMRAEYDFDYVKGVRGKYYKRIIEEGTNVVLLDPDVAKAFPDSAAVNDALRSVLSTRRARRQSRRRVSRKKVATSRA